jgi:hypothetical protein
MANGRVGYAIISNLLMKSVHRRICLRICLGIGLLQLMKCSMRVLKTKEKRIIYRPIIEKIEHPKNA